MMYLRYIRYLLVFAVLTAFLWYGATKNYLLFHSVVEFGNITIYLFVGFLGVFASHMTPDPFLYGLSAIYFSMSLVTAFHTLGYYGMGVFHGWTANEPTQFWILMRFIQGAGIPLVLLFSSRPRFIRIFSAVMGIVTLGGIALVFVGLFPDCFLPGTGLTPFKIGGEYVVALLLVLSIAYSLRVRREEEVDRSRSFEVSLGCFVLAGMSFTLYTDVYGFFNMLGHVLHGMGAWILLTGFVTKSVTALLDRHFYDLRRAKEMAEELSRAKSAFLATMSHEVRTPLNGILSAAALLRDQALDPEERDELLSILVNSGESLMEILNNILDLARLESFSEQPKPTPFQPEMLAREVLELFRGRAMEKGVSLVPFVDSDLPDALLGHPLYLKQVLFNLVGNAVKFTDSGEVRLFLSQMQEHDGGISLFVAVEDTGMGIDSDEVASVFDPFHQAEKAVSARRGGTGLGLAISKRLVESMGGTLSLSSKVGIGSVFSFTIPVVEYEGKLAEPARPGRVAVRLDGLSVLVVEDNEVNREMLRRILERTGASCDYAKNGLEALKKSAAEAYDVIIMDVDMPEMDGCEAARAIRAREGEGGKVPILALSAHVMEEYRQRALEAGMDRFITKPARTEDLLAAVAEAVGLDGNPESAPAG